MITSMHLRVFINKFKGTGNFWEMYSKCFFGLRISHRIKNNCTFVEKKEQRLNYDKSVAEENFFKVIDFRLNENKNNRK